ncbi:MAG: LPS export ABC transporter periplasmic protein LptC [Firmicutes bacterium]|nr:LPS export ABC transporter periplasmic protein LptC [Bacillota bacterium]MCM1476395.1 LPS export ABC transporter periplasmic protein LptC [Bacteroides sp.]
MIRVSGQFSLRTLPLAVAATLLASVMWACAEKEQELMKGNFDPEKFATMTTTNVSTLISDSGVVRYKIVSPLWLVFDQASEPHWDFPKGVHLEKYNDLFRVEAEVKCDSAKYFKNHQLWRLDGYVEITNIAGEKFLTPQLYWDQRHQKLYSDSFIHIERQGRIIEGYGFTSNERLTQYEVKKVMGMFPATDFKVGAGAQQTDSASGARPAPLPATPPTADTTNYATPTQQ